MGPGCTDQVSTENLVTYLAGVMSGHDRQLPSRRSGPSSQDKEPWRQLQTTQGGCHDSSKWRIATSHRAYLAPYPAMMSASCRKPSFS